MRYFMMLFTGLINRDYVIIAALAISFLMAAKAVVIILKIREGAIHPELKSRIKKAEKKLKEIENEDINH